MGFNSTYNLICHKKRIPPPLLTKAFIEFLKEKGIDYFSQEYLTFKQWESNHFLFCIGITPINSFCNDCNKNDENWSLITFSSFPDVLTGWQSALSGDLKTIIECYNVYDISNSYSVERFENGKYSKEKKACSHNGIEYFVPAD